METTAAKRRRLSPQISVSPGNRQPTTITTTTTTTPQESPPARSWRASYASPTRSSLSRHSPDIPGEEQAFTRSPGTDATGHGRGPSSQPRSDFAVSFGSQPEKNPRQDGNATDARHDADSDAHSQMPERLVVKPLRSPMRKLAGAMASRPRRSSVKPTPWPLPFTGTMDDVEVHDPFMEHGLRRSPLTGFSRDTPESGIPLTQTPEVSTSPVVMRNTSSTRRPRRSKTLAEKFRVSPAIALPAEPAEEQRNSVVSATSSPLGILSGDHPGRRRRSEHPSLVRGVDLSGPDADKRQERDALVAEVGQLSADLNKVAEENELIRVSRLTETPVPSLVDRDGIMEILQRHLPPSQEANQVQPSSCWAEMALHPIALLPFSKPSLSLPTLFPEGPTATEPPEQEPISHHPVSMSAEDALPYLKVFTPLRFTSHVSILPKDVRDPSTPLLQQHSIDVTSASPLGLFSAQIGMTVDAKSHAISDLTVPHLDRAAAPELGPYIDTVVNGDLGNNSAVAGNITILTWAMAEWLRLAVRRAKAWRALDRTFASKGGDMAETVDRTHMAAKARRNESEGFESDGADPEDRSMADVMGSLASTSDLLPYMSRRSLDLQVPAQHGEEAEAPSIRVRWRIEFDWTGEGRSRIDMLVGMPGKWHQQDELGRLSGIPTLFDELLQENDDPVTATRTIVALLAGNRS